VWFRLSPWWRLEIACERPFGLSGSSINRSNAQNDRRSRWATIFGRTAPSCAEFMFVGAAVAAAFPQLSLDAAEIMELRHARNPLVVPVDVRGFVARAGNGLQRPNASSAELDGRCGRADARGGVVRIRARRQHAASSASVPASVFAGALARMAAPAMDGQATRSRASLPKDAMACRARHGRLCLRM